LTARDGKAKAKAAGSPPPPSAPPRAPSPRKRGEGYEAALPDSLSPAAGRGLGGGAADRQCQTMRGRCKLREIAEWRIGWRWRGGDWLRESRAAAGARRSLDFLIIARTDSRAVAGFDEAIGRANAAIAAGADMVFVEAPQTVEEVAAVPRLVNGPCLLNVVRG